MYGTYLFRNDVSRIKNFISKNFHRLTLWLVLNVIVINGDRGNKRHTFKLIVVPTIIRRNINPKFTGYI